MSWDAEGRVILIALTDVDKPYINAKCRQPLLIALREKVEEEIAAFLLACELSPIAATAECFTDPRTN